jgi:hypothetical protein
MRGLDRTALERLDPDELTLKIEGRAGHGAQSQNLVNEATRRLDDDAKGLR